MDLAHTNTFADIVRKVNAYKNLTLDVKEMYTQYKNNVGAFLEAQGIVASGKGVVFNYLMKDRTFSDAVILAARDKGLEPTTELKSLQEKGLAEYVISGTSGSDESADGSDESAGDDISAGTEPDAGDNDVEAPFD